MSNDIVFRRIRGHIIPIKMSSGDKRRAKEAAKGAGLALAGGVIAATSGQTYKKAVFKSSGIAMKAFDALVSRPIPKGTQETLFDFAERASKVGGSGASFKTANRLATASRFLKNASIPIGAGLVTLGAFKMLNSVPDKKRRQLDPALVAGGGAAATLIAPKAYQFASKAFEAGMHGRQGTMEFAKSGIRKFGPQLKTLGKSILSRLF